MSSGDIRYITMANAIKAAQTDKYKLSNNNSDIIIAKSRDKMILIRTLTIIICVVCIILIIYIIKKHLELYGTNE